VHLNPARLLFRLLLGRRLPTTRGALTVPSLRSNVRIDRDKWGIPHITAENESDAWFGLGFCQGQDRAFQLEVLLRVMRGTLAELIGPGGLGADRLSRRIGFHRAAPAQLAVLSPDVRAMLEAYAAGVNAGATLGLRRRPHEFVLLRSRPTSWTAIDVVAGLKIQGFVLSSNWDVELARLKVLTADGPEALAALDPAYRHWMPVAEAPAPSAGQALDRLADDLASFSVLVGTGGGSNNWAVCGTRTASRRPLIANDPHLPPTLPAHWYLAHLRTPDWAVAGASFVGGPCIPSGHNGFAAWGVTAALVDNTDLFLEQIGGDGMSVRHGDSFVPCEAHRETIAVRDAEPVTEEVLVTPRGPIVGPAFDGTSEAISLRGVWLDPLPIQGLLRIHRARSLDEVRNYLGEWPTLPLNLVYADSTGRVGWQLFGQTPRRKKGWGTLPLPGWDPTVGWEQQLVPFAEMPHLEDPAEGFVATANNRPQPEDHGPFLGVDWLDGYRAAAANEALRKRTDWDVPSTLELQMSVANLHWREVREALLAAPPDHEACQQALKLLTVWDGQMNVDSSAATIYELFMAKMTRRVARAKAPKSFDWTLGRGHGLLLPHGFLAVRRMGHLAALLRDQPTGWLERTWNEEIADTLRTVVEELRARHGDDPAGWAWGQVRPLTLRHLIDRRPPLDRIYNLGPFPWGGDANTLSQASALPLDPTGNPGFVASLRMVVDVGAWEESRFVLAGGQSGNPFSPHYADQFALWRRGEGVPIPWSEAAVRRATRRTLQLVPMGGPFSDGGPG
jgi:penicillin amidase